MFTVTWTIGGSEGIKTECGISFYPGRINSYADRVDSFLRFWMHGIHLDTMDFHGIQPISLGKAVSLAADLFHSTFAVEFAERIAGPAHDYMREQEARQFDEREV